LTEIVWLTEERAFGRVIRQGAFFSLIAYSQGGIDYEVLMENDEFESIGEDYPVDDEPE